MIVNGTSHTINLYSLEDTIAIQGGRKLVLKEGAAPLMVVPAGTNLNAQKGNLPAPKVAGMPQECVKGAVVFTAHDPIPKAAIVIVSNLYRSAVKELGGDTSRLATVDGAVYADESAVRPVGCTALAVG